MLLQRLVTSVLAQSSARRARVVLWLLEPIAASGPELGLAGDSSAVLLLVLRGLFLAGTDSKPIEKGLTRRIVLEQPFLCTKIKFLIVVFFSNQK